MKQIQDINNYEYKLSSQYLIKVIGNKYPWFVCWFGGDFFLTISGNPNDDWNGSWGLSEIEEIWELD